MGAIAIRPTETLTANDVVAHVRLIQEVMRAVMKDKTHYGLIPGCPKPSLWKPGAEVLFTTFRISVDSNVEDLSDGEHARFRVTARATSASGQPLGSAMGEASSEEEKYCWRAAVCQQEWEEAAPNRRRRKWKSGQQPYSVDQVRTVVADVRNTVLKMAVKRAFVALALQVTAASDIFAQDIEDLPEEVAGEVAAEGAPAKPPIPRVERKAAQASQTAPSAPSSAPPMRPAPGTEPTISELQAKRLYAIARGAGHTDASLKDLVARHGFEHSRDITKSSYDSICAEAQVKVG